MHRALPSQSHEGGLALSCLLELLVEPRMVLFRE